MSIIGRGDEWPVFLEWNWHALSKDMREKVLDDSTFSPEIKNIFLIHMSFFVVTDGRSKALQTIHNRICLVKPATIQTEYRSYWFKNNNDPVTRCSLIEIVLPWQWEGFLLQHFHKVKQYNTIQYIFDEFFIFDFVVIPIRERFLMFPSGSHQQI